MQATLRNDTTDRIFESMGVQENVPSPRTMTSQDISTQPIALKGVKVRGPEGALESVLLTERQTIPFNTCTEPSTTTRVVLEGIHSVLEPQLSMDLAAIHAAVTPKHLSLVPLKAHNSGANPTVPAQ